MAKQAHLQAIISAVDRLSPALGKIGVNTTKTKALLASLNTASFARLRGTLRMVTKSVGDVGGALRNASQQLLPLAGLGALSVAGLGFGFLSASRGAIAYAASVQDAADITGIAYGEVQKWHGLFRNGGVGVEESTQAIVKFGEQVRNASEGGNKNFLALMNRLRIPLKDVKGQLRPVNDLMLDFADGVAAQTNPMTRNAILIAAFGKAGSKMVPTFKDGAASMRELLDVQERMGKVLGEDGGAVLDALGKKQVELGQQMRVLAASVLSGAAPAFDKLFASMQKWVAGNRELIQQRLGAVISDLADRLSRWVDNGGIQRLIDRMGALWDRLGKLVGMFGGLGNIAMIFGALLLAGPVASLVSLGAAVGRLSLVLLPLLGKGLAALGLAAWPVVAVGAALAGVAYLIYRNWDVVGPFLARVWERIKTTATVAWNVLRFLFGWSPLGIVINNWDAIVSWMGVFWDNLKGVASAGIELLTGLVLSWKPLRWVMAAWDPVISFFKGLWDKISGYIAPVLKAASRISGLFGGAITTQFGAQANGQSYGPRIAAAPTPLVQAGAMQASARVQGDMRVRFENAPAGMRVDPGKTNAPGLGFSPDVGYRSMGGIG